DNVAPELSSAVYALAEDGARESQHIIVTFDEDVQNVDTADFKVEINGSEQSGYSISDEYGENDQVLITLDDEVKVSQTSTITIVSDDNGNVSTKDTAENPAKVGSSVKASTTKVVPDLEVPGDSNGNDG